MPRLRLLHDMKLLSFNNFNFAKKGNSRGSRMGCMHVYNETGDYVATKQPTPTE